MDLFQDENETLQRITKSILLQYKHGISEDQRKMAMKVSEDFKNDIRSLKLAFSLIHSNNEPVVRHFGLSVFEHHFKHTWSSQPSVLTDKQKESIKNSLIAYIRSLPVNEVHYLKEKVAVVIVELLKNEIYKTGSNTITFLVNLVNQDSEQIEIILNIIRILCEEVIKLPKKKATIAINSIIDETEKTLFPFLYYVLNKYYIMFNEVSSTSNDPNMLTLASLMITASLKTLLSLAESDWFPLNSFSQKNGKEMLSALIHLLCQSQFALESAEVLVVLLSRKERSQLVFMTELIPNIENALNSINPNSIVDENFDEKKYMFIERINQIISFLTQAVLDVLNLKKDADVVLKLLTMNVDMAKHPSLLISNMSLQLWKRVIAIEQFHTQPYFQEMCSVVIHSFSDKLKRWKYEDPLPDLVSLKFRQMDFTDADDYLSFFEQMRSSIVQELFIPISNKFPHLALNFLNAFLEDCIATQNNINNDPVKTEIANTYFFSIKSLATYISKLIASVNKKNESDPEFIALTSKFFGNVFGFVPNTPQIYMIQLNIISSSIKAVENDKEAIKVILKKMLETIGLVGDSPQDLSSLSKEMVDIRFMAAKCLLDIGKSLPHMFVDMLDALVDMITKSEALLPVEREKLYGFLAAIGNALDPGTHKQLLEYLLLPYIEKWRSPEYSMAVHDRAGFADYFLITDPDNPAGLNNRDEFLKTLRMIEAVYNPVQSLKPGLQMHPMSEIDASVLENVFKLIQTIHYFWSPDSRDILGKTSPIIYEIDQAIAKSWLKSSEHVYQNELHKFFINTRTLSYKILGHAAKHVTPIFTHYFSNIAETFFLHTEFIDIINWKYLLKHTFSHFYKFCPSEEYGKLSLLFETIFNVMRNTFSNEWKRIHGESNEPPESEIVAKRAIVETTNDYIKFLNSIVIKNKMFTDFFKFMLQSGKSAWPLLFIMDVINWHDPSLSRKSIGFISDILNKLIDTEEESLMKGTDIKIQNLDPNLVNTLYHNGLKSIIDYIGHNPTSFPSLSIFLMFHKFNTKLFEEVFLKYSGMNHSILKNFSNSIVNKGKAAKEKAVKALLEKIGVNFDAGKVRVDDISSKNFAEYLQLRSKAKDDQQESLSSFQNIFESDS